MFERGEHVGERRPLWGRVPRGIERPIERVADTREPDGDQAVEQHGDGRGAEYGLAAPALRFLEAQVGLASLEGPLDRLTSPWADPRPLLASAPGVTGPGEPPRRRS